MDLALPKGEIHRIVRQYPGEFFCDASHVDHDGGLIEATLYSEFPGYCFIIDGVPECAAPSIVGIIGESHDCENDVVASADLPAGDYAIWVGPQVFSGYPCGTSNDYYFELVCEAAIPCEDQVLEGIAKVAGEEVALQTKIPNAFMHFQAMAYDKDPTNYSLFSGKDVFKRGDYVELLAHDDLYVSVSLCPLGDQHDMASKETLTTFPVKVKIFEGADGPLETAPDPEFKSMTHEEFIKNGFKQTPSGRVGDKNSESGFE